LYNYCFWLLVCGGVNFGDRYGIDSEKLSEFKKKDKKFREINQEEKIAETTENMVDENVEESDLNQNLNHLGEEFKKQPKLKNREAEQRLKGTVSAEKIELLWQDYGVSYGKDLLAIERKGSIVLRKWLPDPEKQKIYLKMKAQRAQERKEAEE
jgi:hypothetical protein